MTQYWKTIPWQRLKKPLRFLLLAGMLLGFFLYVPAGQIFSAVLSADPWYFALGLLLSFPAVFLATLSTWILARRQGITVSLGEFYSFNLAIRFYSFFSPASMVSTALRWHKLSAGNKSAEALSAISFTRLFSIVIAVGMGLFWLLSKGDDRPWLNVMLLGLLLIAMIVGWLLLTRLSPYLSTQLKDRLGNIKQGWLQKTVHFLSKYLDSIAAYARMPYGVLIGVALTHIGQEFLGLIAHILMAQALSIPLSIYDLGWLRAISFLSALAPFTLAGGVGLREVSLVLALSAFNVGPDLAAAYSFLVYARNVLFSLVCGLVELVVISRSS